jgi:hypothetical protein
MIYRWVQLIIQRLAPPKVPRGPARLNVDADVANSKRDPPELDNVSSQTLMKICDDYWSWLAQPMVHTTAGVAEAKERYRNHVLAVNQLSLRGPEILDWAGARVAHDDYDAREQAAFLIGEVARRHPLGDRLGAVVRALSQLAVRPVSLDCKEAQANHGAVLSLGKIGDRKAIWALRHVLTAAEWEGDEIQSDAAEALGSVLGEPFADCEDPVDAAQDWLRSHPNG